MQITQIKPQIKPQTFNGIRRKQEAYKEAYELGHKNLEKATNEKRDLMHTNQRLMNRNVELQNTIDTQAAALEKEKNIRRRGLETIRADQAEQKVRNIQIELHQSRQIERSVQEELAQSKQKVRSVQEELAQTNERCAEQLTSNKRDLERAFLKEKRDLKMAFIKEKLDLKSKLSEAKDKKFDLETKLIDDQLAFLAENLDLNRQLSAAKNEKLDLILEKKFYLNIALLFTVAAWFFAILCYYRIIG